MHPINDSFYVASDGEEVRGGSWLRELNFSVEGIQHRMGWMKYPVAESLIDQKYAGVPGSMVLQLLRQQPNLMALGMGGHDAPFARLLTGIKWKAATIPLFFRIMRPFRVLRKLRYARNRAWRRTAMEVGAWTGAGWLLNRALQLTAGRPHRGVSVTVEPKFRPWADAIWEKSRGSYRSLATRDGRALDFLYPSDLPDFDRLRMTRNGSDLGWACTQILQATPRHTSYFGDLKVGMIPDTLGPPSEASAVLGAAVRHLEERGVDLVITYLVHDAWTTAARRMRFIPGPSTLAFYRSPRADTLLLNGSSLSAACHLTASDCHGAAGI